MAERHEHAEVREVQQFDRSVRRFIVGVGEADRTALVELEDPSDLHCRRCRAHENIAFRCVHIEAVKARLMEELEE